MLLTLVKAQRIMIKPYNIGDRVSEFPLLKMVNYKDDSASIASFGQKLLIIDFWGTRCGSCIQALPKENELQTEFRNEIQFILVTSDDSSEVTSFLDRYNKKNKKLEIPIVTSDVLIQQMFLHLFLPHFVWISSDGTLLAQTSTAMLKKEVIEAVLKDIQIRKDHLNDKHFPDKYFHFLPPSNAQETFFQHFKN